MLESLAIYIVIAILLGEGAVLAVLLLPLPPFIAKPITQWMKLINRNVLIGFILLTVFLFLESYWSMSYYENAREEARGKHHYEDRLKSLFRSQRNFYMTLFAVLNLVIIFRVRQLVSTIATLKDRIEKLQPGKPSD